MNVNALLEQKKMIPVLVLKAALSIQPMKKNGINVDVMMAIEWMLMEIV